MKTGIGRYGSNSPLGKKLARILSEGPATTRELRLELKAERRCVISWLQWHCKVIGYVNQGGKETALWERKGT